MLLTEEIKRYALDLGYSRVGITTADPFPMYAEAMEERSQDYDWAAQSDFIVKTGDPKDRLPYARSIIVAIYDYFREHFPDNLVGKIGRLYQSRSYIEPPTRLGGARVQLMRQFLKNKGMQVGPWLMSTTGLPNRPAAVRAGLGQIGRNTFFCAPDIGTFVLIHIFIVDAELEYDSPVNGTHCPPDCRRCIEACPTGAIVDDFRINPRRCLTFNHYINTYGFPNTTPYIDRELRPKMASWIHGCDVCQEVCPKNQKKLKAELPPNAFLELKTDNVTENMVVAPLFHAFMRDRKYFRRNAAVALGNSGDSEMTPYLAEAMNDPEELVRVHAAWALGNLDGAKARFALETSLTRENSRRVREEINMALANK